MIPYAWVTYFSYKIAFLASSQSQSWGFNDLNFQLYLLNSSNLTYISVMLNSCINYLFSLNTFLHLASFFISVVYLVIMCYVIPVVFVTSCFMWFCSRVISILWIIKFFQFSMIVETCVFLFDKPLNVSIHCSQGGGGFEGYSQTPL